MQTTLHITTSQWSHANQLIWHIEPNHFHDIIRHLPHMNDLCSIWIFV